MRLREDIVKEKYSAEVVKNKKDNDIHKSFLNYEQGYKFEINVFNKKQSQEKLILRRK